MTDSNTAATSVGGPRVGAPSTHNHFLLIDPDEIVFTNVKAKQTYSQSIRLTNPLTVPVEFGVRAGNAARYTLSPTNFSLRGGETVLLEVRLRVLNMPSRPTKVAGVNQPLGTKDIFHIRSDFFTQKFHASWFPWSGTTPAPTTTTGPSSTNSSTSPSSSHAHHTICHRPQHGVPHSLPASSSMPLGYPNDQIAPCAAVQRQAEAAQAALKEKAAKKVQKQVDEAKEAEEKRVRLLVEEIEKRKDEEEKMLFRPLERVNLASAKKAISQQALQPASLRSARKGTTSNGENGVKSPSSSSLESGATTVVSTREYLAMSQKLRAAQSELDAKVQEVQQWEFNYNALEKEYKFVLQQLDSLHAASRTSRPADLQSQLDQLLYQERAANESKNKKVLLILQEKDALLRSQEETIARQQQQLEQQSYELGELEETINTQAQAARQEERQMQETIDDLRARLIDAQLNR